MRVKISAHSTLDVPHLARAGRFFPTKGFREIEVLEQDDDPPEIVVKVKNQTTGKMQDETRPDQDRMGRKSYARIVEDGRFSIHETGSVDSLISGAEVAAARAEVGRIAALNMDLKGELAKADAELTKAKDRIRELEELATSPEPKKAKKSE